MKDPILAASGCNFCSKSILNTILTLCVLATIVGCTSNSTDPDYSNPQIVRLTSVKTTNGSGQAVFRVTATNGGMITAYAVKVHGQEVRQNVYGTPTTLDFTQSIAMQIDAGQSSSVDVLEWRDVWHRQARFTATWTE